MEITIDNIVDFKSRELIKSDTTEEDIDPVKVLDAAKEKDLSTVICIGVRKDGDLYLASSTGSVVEMHWLLSVGARIAMDVGMNND